MMSMNYQSPHSSPTSCDTFVVLPPKTNGPVIFGKNSDRPESEVQEVVLFPAKDYQAEDSTVCTYIEIPAVSHTNAVMLSKPAWMWGAEMGANEHGVCIGNEAVFTKALQGNEKEERLIGMDYVRLGLERAKTAKEAMDVITSLLEKHGQGGLCYEDTSKADIIYHNSFIIADATEAWVLETAGQQWAAEHVTSGFRNISNQLSIGTKIDAMSADLKNFAKEQGFWDGNEEFNFAKSYQKESPFDVDEKYSGSTRYNCGRDLLDKYSKDGNFSVISMMDILRDYDSGICMVGKGQSMSVSTGSQVSLLHPPGKRPSCHWFTATPNPACSVFKPFIFVPDTVGSSSSVSPVYEEDPAKIKPRFQKQVDRGHALYKAHSEAVKPLAGDDANIDLVNELKGIEKHTIHDIEEFLENYDESLIGELKDLFKDSVSSEMKFY